MNKQKISATLITAPATTTRKTSTVPQNRQIEQLANVWQSMSGTDKTTWAILAGQATQANTLDVPTKVGGYQLFIQNNISILNTGSPALTTAPANVIPATPFPLLTLNANYGPGGLVLSLITATAYPDKVLIYAARPLTAGRNTYKKGSFHLVGSLPSLASGPSSLTSIYNTKYHVPSPGYEVALQLVGITAHGFRTPRLLVTAIALAPGQVASGTDDLEMHKVA